MREKILVIGGSGFIGSHVSDEFTKKKFDVTILDKKKNRLYFKRSKIFTCLHKR